MLVLLASAVFGADPYGVREHVLGSATGPERQAARSRDAGDATGTTIGTVPGDQPPTVLRSEPWWQGVATLKGTGAAAAQPFTIDAGAIQWRVKWTCSTGRLTVRAPTVSKPIVDAACPGNETAYGSRSGPVNLEVTADGAWTLQVDQQIDVPLAEAPLPAMTAPGTVKVATGGFYRVDQFSNGTVTVYRLADGTYALRLEDFYVTPNTDLEIRFDTLAAPHSTQQVSSSETVSVAPLDVTAGSMNFTIPPSVNPSHYQSVVIWCERLFSAYAAATLAPPS